ncbi:MAG: hypothetical protein IPH13_16330 [Planctomycetes bacterium]|nr:hypothetical protein [Planctomycetota bacterium]
MIHRCARLVALALAFGFAPTTLAQELPLSGTNGVFVFEVTQPGGLTQMHVIAPTLSATSAVPIGNPVTGVPSRWAHRRRTLGALETELAFAPPFVVMAPMGDVVGTGGIHFVDARTNPITSTLVQTGGNPIGYDLLVDSTRQRVYAVSDDGLGGTIVHGFSYATPGTLTALTPPSVTLPGAPSAYVNRITIDPSTSALIVPTSTGLGIVAQSASAPQIAQSAFLSTGVFAPATNAAPVTRAGSTQWSIGLCRFDTINNAPREAGIALFDTTAIAHQASFGIVPLVPSKFWVPAAGTHELAVVGDGVDAYVYFLLREPGPGTFFVKPSAIGALALVGNNAPYTGIVSVPNLCGEPFAIPTTFGARVAFESSFGLPFTPNPPGGGEINNLLYTPLDPLGASTTFGLVAVPGPLGGRISTKGYERPLWSRDGTRLVATTSHFPGAPNPGVPGVEVLEVPADVVLTEFNSPSTIVPSPTFPVQAILQPGTFLPRDPNGALAVNGLSFVGNVFNDGLRSVALTTFGAVGQYQIETPNFVQSPDVPNFPAIFPPAFLDATGSLTAVPATFGARRTSFNLIPGFGLSGMVMAAAVDDEVVLQLTGYDTLAALGLFAPAPALRFALPAGGRVSSEITSL